MSGLAISREFATQFGVAGVQGVNIVAAGAGDNTEITSGDIDTDGFDSGAIVICGRTNCAVGQTLKATVKVATADDNGAGAPGAYGADETLVTMDTVATGAAAAQNFAYKLALKLKASRKRWMRIKVTPDLSAGAADTAQIGVVLIKGGADVLPVA